MKKLTLIALIPMFILSLTSCNKKQEEKPTYNEGFVYSEPIYEPLNVAHEDNDIFILSTDLLGVSKGVKAADWDNNDIKLRVKYSDYTIKDFDLKVKNIPLEMRHYLGEVGTQHIYLFEYKWTSTYTFDIIENPDWHGYKCEFFDKDKNYLSTENVGFYQEVKYNGPEIKVEDDDYDYHYNFVGWNHSTKYIHQDMQFVTKYERKEKRYFANKPYNNDHIGLAALVDKNKSKGSGLVYLGRVRHVAGYYTETKELDNEDISFSFKEEEYGKFYNQYNESIVKYSVEYIDDSDYDSKIYGNPYEIINNPTFALQFDSRYNYDGVSALLDDKSDVKLSNVNPYDGLFDEINRMISSYPSRTVKKDEEPGYYRYSIIFSVDVYLSISFNRIGSDIYEIGNFNNFIMAPVKNSAQAIVQFSKDGNFTGEVKDKLQLSTKGIYSTADMFSWGTWEE